MICPSVVAQGADVDGHRLLGVTSAVVHLGAPQTAGVWLRCLHSAIEEVVRSSPIRQPPVEPRQLVGSPRVYD